MCTYAAYNYQHEVARRYASLSRALVQKAWSPVALLPDLSSCSWKIPFSWLAFRPATNYPSSSLAAHFPGLGFLWLLLSVTNHFSQLLKETLPQCPFQFHVVQVVPHSGQYLPQSHIRGRALPVPGSLVAGQSVQMTFHPTSFPHSWAEACLRAVSATPCSKVYSCARRKVPYFVATSILRSDYTQEVSRCFPEVNSMDAYKMEWILKSISLILWYFNSKRTAANLVLITTTYCDKSHCFNNSQLIKN